MDGLASEPALQNSHLLPSVRGDPLDKLVQVEGVHFRVVGVSAKKGSFLGNSLDETAVIPLQLFQKLYGARAQLSIVVNIKKWEALPKPYKAALESAVNDDQEVEISVMLAADAGSNPVRHP